LNRPGNLQPSAAQQPPFEIGDRIRPSELHGWTYVGLSGRPDRDAHAVRRYRKGHWCLELRAYANRALLAKVVSIRTLEEDTAWWAAKRDS
jgi:hypothetical protein